jgi:tetratricopeptide (TPR) repeat protein/TolB-like protein
LDSNGQSGLSELERCLADRYTFGPLVAAGGMADVYSATDIRHRRRVAIKVMRRESVGFSGRTRFTREIAIAANLSHPNIVPLFDSGQAGMNLYYVMPFVDGPSLRERIASGPLPLDEALRITTQIGDALAYAHTLGVVHRDIKPANILLSRGNARVADFGVAKALQEHALDDLTTSDGAIGTLVYMSPEQAGMGGTVDARSDQYALALVLYEMLAGKRPFDAASPSELIAQKMAAAFPPLASIDRTIPDGVDRAIERALAPSGAERFGSVSEFIEALGSGPVADSPIASLRRVLPKRGKWRPVILTVALASIVGIAATLALRPWRSPAPPPPALGIGRIVVVPFSNRTGKPAFDDVGLMAGDWLTQGLQMTGILDVVPTVSAFSLDSLARHAQAALTALAKETGASTLVSGAYYLQGDSLVFSLQVVDQAGGRVVNSVTDVFSPASNPMPGIYKLRTQLMGWLAVHYDERLQSSASAGSHYPNYEAYRVFSDGMTRYARGDNKSAQPLFLQAYSLDSSYIQPLLYASITMTNLGEWRRADSLLTVVSGHRDALSEYDRAWLDYRLAFIHADVDATMTAIRTIDRLSPSSKGTYNHGVAAFQAGLVREALRTIESLEPDRGAMRGFASYWSLYGSIVHVLGDYDREQGIGVAARAAFPDRMIVFPPLLRAAAARGRFAEIADLIKQAKALPADPYFWDLGLLLAETTDELRAHGFKTAAADYGNQLRDWLRQRDTTPTIGWRLAQAAYSVGDWKSAEQRLNALRVSSPQNLDYLGTAGALAAHLGDRARALAISDSLKRRTEPYTFGLPTVYRARIAAVLGDRDASVLALRQSLSEGRAFQAWLHRDIDFESLHNYPPFEKLLRGRD